MNTQITENDTLASDVMASHALNQKEQKEELDRLMNTMHLSDVFRKKNERGNRADPVERVYVWNRGTHLIDTPKDEVLMLSTREKGHYTVSTINGNFRKEDISLKEVKDVVKDYLSAVAKKHKSEKRIETTTSTNGQIIVKIPHTAADSMVPQLQNMISSLSHKLEQTKDAIKSAEQQQEVDLEGLVESEELIKSIKNPTLKETLQADVEKINEAFNMRADQIQKYAETVKDIEMTIKQFKLISKQLQA